MPVVQHTLEVVGGAGAAATVTISRHPRGSFAADGHSEVVLPKTITPGPAGNPTWPAGHFEADLPAEDDYAADGYYVATYSTGESHAFQVPATVGPHWLADLLTVVGPASTVLPARLSGLRDTTALAAATAGQVPVYDGTAWIPGAGGSGGGVSDHGLLTGLTDDDHGQYLTTGRGDARYYTQAQTTTLLAGKASTATTDALGTRVGALEAVDPLTQAEGDARYSQLGHDHAGTYLATALVDAKGDLLAATADNTVGRLAVGSNGQVLTADSTAGAGVRWATPSSGGGTRMSLADQMGCACVTQDPSLITSAAVGLTSGTLYGCSAILPAGRSLTTVLVGLRQNGATPTGVSKLGVLDSTGARLGMTADTATLWTTGQTTATGAALTATIAADATNDRLIYLVMLSTCSTPPQVYLGQLLTNSLFSPNPTAGRRSWVLAGQTDIPASVDLSTVTLNSGVFQLYAR